MADDTKTTKAAAPKTAPKTAAKAEPKPTHTYEKGRFRGVKVGGVMAPHFFGKSAYEAESGEVVHLKMDNGDTYVGKVDECVKVDGEVCISFVNDKLERLKKK